MKPSKNPMGNIKKYRNWTTGQLHFLLENYGKLPAKVIAEKIGKPVGSVFYILKKEGVDKNLRYWIQEDILLLQTCYKDDTNEELARRLNRSIDSIQLKAASLGLKKGIFWSRQEIEQLAKMKKEGLSYEEMAIKLKREESSIHNKLISENLTTKLKRWTEEELTLIKQMATSNQLYTYMDIAREVNSNIKTIRSLCIYQGWNNTIKRSVSVGAEQLEAILRKLFPSMKIEHEYHIGERLKLDLYLPQLDLGAEYDGIQHFQHTPIFHKSKDDFKRAQIKDLRKEELCEARGISLIRIRYDEELTKELVKYKISEAGYGDGEFSKEAILSYKEKKQLLQQEILGRILENSKKQIQEIKKKKKVTKFKTKWPSPKIPSRPFPKKKDK